MTFWQWFKSDGDRVFSFVTLASLALQGTPGIDPQVVHIAMISGILATAAHQSFFPTEPAPPAKVP